MFIVGLLSWWYGAGWKQRVLLVRERLASTIDYFSIGLLARTLFAPFRQISAGKVDGPFAIKWRAFVDRLISRVIGAIVRSMMMLIGAISIVFFSLIGGIAVILWALIPLFPILGIIMFLVGWTPSWM